MQMQEFFKTLPNWLQSLLVALAVAIGASISTYVTTNQQVTWGGLVAAIVAGLGNWFTTNYEKKKNQELASSRFQRPTDTDF